MSKEKKKEKESFAKRHPVVFVILLIFIGFSFIGFLSGLLGPLFENNDSLDSDIKEAKPIIEEKTGAKAEEQIEISIGELYSIFGDYSELSEIQKEERYKTEYKDKIIKTSIYVDKVSKASLSTQYVVLEMFEYPYDFSCVAKAFFPSSEKDKLLNANIGDTIVFTGKLTNYDFGFASCLTFSNSKVLEIKKMET